MGRLRIKKKKDWKAKFRKAQPVSAANGSLSLDLISPLEMAKDRLEDPLSEPKHEHLSLQERNIFLLDAAINIFDLSKGKWPDIKRTISAEQVGQLYEVVADLWHPKTNIGSLFPPPGPDLRALYFGSLDPGYFPRNIYRFSLYADQIFLIDPFHKPHALRDEFNPLNVPDRYRNDTIRRLYFLLEADPWIRSGLVTLIPNPGEFDFEFRDEAFRLAKERAKNFRFSEEDLEENSREGKEDFRRFIRRLPKDELARKMYELNPRISAQEVEVAYEYMMNERRDDPLALDQTIEGVDDQITGFGGGGNLETALFLSNQIGGFPYASLKWRWRELLSSREGLSEVAEIWSPLTKAFQDLDFKFLDNVDSRFAYEMRDDGRLESFRSFLRRAWKAVEGELDPAKIDTLASEFGDELSGEYRKAQAEWQRIDTDLLKWFGAAVSGALISGGFSFVPPALPLLGAAGLGVFKLIESHRTRKQFREEFPMSVFIDLSRKSNR